MKKDRFGRYLPIMTAVTAMAFYPATSNAQTMTDKARSAMTDTADEAKAVISGAPSPGSPAAVLSEIHETDEGEMKVGRLAEKKGASADVRAYGKTLAHDHAAADRKVIGLAKEEGIELPPAAGATVDLQKKENHNGAVAEMLANVSGNTFDRDFLEAMRKDHERDIAKLTDAMNSTSDPKLKRLIAELLPKLKHHEEIAQKLLEEANKSASTEGKNGSGY
jgi:putative membrane protein